MSPHGPKKQANNRVSKMSYIKTQIEIGASPAVVREKVFPLIFPRLSLHVLYF
jgi:hypothetical protein